MKKRIAILRMNIQIEERTLSLLIPSLQLTGEKELMSERLFSVHDCSETVTKKKVINNNFSYSLPGWLCPLTCPAGCAESQKSGQF